MHIVASQKKDYWQLVFFNPPFPHSFLLCNLKEPLPQLSIAVIGVQKPVKRTQEQQSNIRITEAVMQEGFYKN